MKILISKQKQKTRRTLVLAVIVIVLVAVSVLIFLPHLRDAAPEPTTTTQYIYYSGHQLPVYEDVDKNLYAAEAFSSSGGFIRYAPSAQYGIDVSTHQGEIDWQAVASAGIDFAIIRLGYRGYTAGGLNFDDYFTANIEGARAAGLDVGVYFFSQATTNAEAEEEAKFVLDALHGYEISYPVVFDWEIIYDENARTNNVTGDELTNFTLKFCETIEQAGYTPAIYFNAEVGYLMYDMSRISKYDLWLAEYDSYPEFYYNFQMWQYTAAGRIPGIAETVDLNISFVDYAA